MQAIIDFLQVQAAHRVDDPAPRAEMLLLMETADTLEAEMEMEGE